MSVKEVSRVKVVEAVVSKRMKQHEAARVLCLTTRQMRRLQLLCRIVERLVWYPGVEARSVIIVLMNRSKRKQ